MSIVNKSKITILISPTKLCNLRCTYCYLSNTVKEDKTILSLPLFKKIIKKIIIEKPIYYVARRRTIVCWIKLL